VINEQFGSNKKTILVVDDESDFVKIITSDLEDMGYQIIKAYSGRECLKKIEELKPDLVILDFMMPEMSGSEVLNTLRNENNKVPVILLTVHNLRYVEDKARHYTVKCMSKPYKLDELQATIEDLIGA
jgi:CheY-like chemotaxis protein